MSAKSSTVLYLEEVKWAALTAVWLLGKAFGYIDSDSWSPPLDLEFDKIEQLAPGWHVTINDDDIWVTTNLYPKNARISVEVGLLERVVTNIIIEVHSYPDQAFLAKIELLYYRDRKAYYVQRANLAYYLDPRKDPVKDAFQTIKHILLGLSPRRGPTIVDKLSRDLNYRELFLLMMAAGGSNRRPRNKKRARTTTES